MKCTVKYPYIHEYILECGWGTDVGGFLVVIVVGYVASESKVGHFQHVVRRHQDVACCQVTMNALHTTAVNISVIYLFIYLFIYFCYKSYRKSTVKKKKL